MLFALLDLNINLRTWQGLAGIQIQRFEVNSIFPSILQFFSVEITFYSIIAAHSAYEMFSWYKYLIVSLFFPASVFGVGIFF